MKPEPTAAPLLPFRVHFEDGTKLDLAAPDAKAAAALAAQRHTGIIRKTKLVRETAGEVATKPAPAERTA